MHGMWRQCDPNIEFYFSCQSDLDLEDTLVHSEEEEIVGRVTQTIEANAEAALDDLSAEENSCPVLGADVHGDRQRHA